MKMKKYSKEEAIEIVVSCAEAYSRELLNKSLLLVCQDKHNQVGFMEFFFYDRNFLHLTGLKPKRRSSKDNNGDESQNSKDFFYNCLSHTVSPEDFEFAPDGTTQLKLGILPHLVCKNLSANMIGDYSSARPKLYTEKLAGGTKGCMGFLIDGVTNRYVPNTVLNEDIRNIVGNWARVILVYRKEITEERYSEITYAAKKTEWDKITFPEQYQYLPKPQFVGQK